jgi:hypothetical protein
VTPRLLPLEAGELRAPVSDARLAQQGAQVCRDGLAALQHFVDGRPLQLLPCLRQVHCILMACTVPCTRGTVHAN